MTGPSPKRWPPEEIGAPAGVVRLLNDSVRASLCIGGSLDPAFTILCGGLLLPDVGARGFTDVPKLNSCAVVLFQPGAVVAAGPFTIVGAISLESISDGSTNVGNVKPPSSKRARLALPPKCCFIKYPAAPQQGISKRRSRRNISSPAFLSDSKRSTIVMFGVVVVTVVAVMLVVVVSVEVDPVYVDVVDVAETVIVVDVAVVLVVLQ